MFDITQPTSAWATRFPWWDVRVLWLCWRGTQGQQGVNVRAISSYTREQMCSLFISILSTHALRVRHVTFKTPPWRWPPRTHQTTTANAPSTRAERDNWQWTLHFLALRRWRIFVNHRSWAWSQGLTYDMFVCPFPIIQHGCDCTNEPAVIEKASSHRQWTRNEDLLFPVDMIFSYLILSYSVEYLDHPHMSDMTPIKDIVRFELASPLFRLPCIQRHTLQDDAENKYTPRNTKSGVAKWNLTVC